MDGVAFDFASTVHRYSSSDVSDLTMFASTFYACPVSVDSPTPVPDSVSSLVSATSSATGTSSIDKSSLGTSSRSMAVLFTASSDPAPEAGVGIWRAVGAPSLDAFAAASLSPRSSVSYARSAMVLAACYFSRNPAAMLFSFSFRASPPLTMARRALPPHESAIL